MSKEELIQTAKFDKSSQYRMFEFLGENNDPRYNHTKAAEELIELAEVLLKKVNKKPDQQPSDQEIIDEIGDVFIRLHILTKTYTTDAVEERMVRKANKYLQYVRDGKYDGGV